MRRKETDISELKNIFEDIKALARVHNCKEIRVNTWLFAVHPKLRAELGFVIEKKGQSQVSEKDFFRGLGYFDVKKILKEDVNGNL